MQTQCYRRGQGEVGIVTSDGRVFATFNSSVQGHDTTAYTRNDGDGLAVAPLAVVHPCDGCGGTTADVDLWAENTETGEEIWLCLACGAW